MSFDGCISQVGQSEQAGQVDFDRRVRLGFRGIELLVFVTSLPDPYSIQNLPVHLRKSLTWDQGAEMAPHEQACAPILPPPSRASSPHFGRCHVGGKQRVIGSTAGCLQVGPAVTGH